MVTVEVNGMQELSQTFENNNKFMSTFWF